MNKTSLNNILNVNTSILPLHEICQNTGFIWSVFSCLLAESESYLNKRFCPNTGKYRYNFVHVRENANQRKPVFRHISQSVLLNIFSHNLDLCKNISSFSAQKLFVHKYMNCLSVQKLKAGQ